MKLLKEFVELGLQNPLDSYKKPFSEASYSDIKLGSVKAIYPLIRAITTSKITQNFTFYPAESMTNIGTEAESPRGYLSFTYPYPKPVITEHRLSDNTKGKADEPIGRVIASFWKGHTSEKQKDLRPGFVEGDGALYLVPAITDKQGIEKVTSGIYHTVSIGTRAFSAVESVTGTDIINPTEKDELPDWNPGSIVEDDKGNKKLSYIEVLSIGGREISFVNAPSDTHAQVKKTDLGKDGIRLLTGLKTKEGEIKFYDISTREEVMVECDRSTINMETWQDSLETTENKVTQVYKINKTFTEKNETSLEVGQFVEFRGLFNQISGKVVNIYPEGIVENNNISLNSSASNPVVRIKVYKNGEPTKTYVNKNLSLLLQKEQI